MDTKLTLAIEKDVIYDAKRKGISKSDVVLALNSRFKHLEDALQHYGVISHSKIDVILTGNIKDYRNSEIPVMTPETYLKS